MQDYSHEHVDLEPVDEPGAPETAPHPLAVDDEEARRGGEVYQNVDDLDDNSDAADVALEHAQEISSRRADEDGR